jgi:hypothetical protein
MKKIGILLLFQIVLFLNRANASDNTLSQSQFDCYSLGLGYGLDYGGIGGNLLIYPQKNIGLFGGLGYAFAGLGCNAGIKLRFNTEEPSSKSFPYLIGMYGYNAAIAVSNKMEYNKLFYGATFGIGMDYRSVYLGDGYWSFSILLPLRSYEVQNYIDDLQRNHNVTFKNKLFPIAISVAYRIILD